MVTIDSTRAPIDAQKWHTLGAILIRDDYRLLDGYHRKQFLDKWKEIADHESRLDDRLVIGLVGGTGVGKSTFINALGGQEVSQSSDRRPTTDRVIVYRHVEGELPPRLPVEHLAQPQVLHDNDLLARIILLDFPDFDSAEAHHREILEQYVGELDILFILVDDMKYGDRALYELLATLPQDCHNMFAILNKVDRLRQRYGDRTHEVAQEILRDLREKLTDYANIDLDEKQTMAISALRVFQNRAEGLGSNDIGEFSQIETLLANYRYEKLRIAAKEINLEARKSQFAATVRESALNDERQAVIQESADLLSACRVEAKSMLDGMSTGFLTDRERASRRRQRMRDASLRWGVPYSIGFTLLGEFRRKARGGKPAELTSRILAHYRTYFQLLRNLIMRCSSELTGISACDFEDGLRRTSDDAQRSWAITRAREFQLQVSGDRKRAKAISRLSSHLPGIGVLAFSIWSVLYEPIRSIVDDEAGGATGALLWSMISVISPTFLFGTLLGVVLAYTITGLWLWAREIQLLNYDVDVAEKALDDHAHQYGEGVLASLDSETSQLRKEFEEMKHCLSKME